MSIYDASCKIKEELSSLYSYGEEALTSMFLNNITDHRHVKAFRFSQRNERKTGADWLWLICSENGVYVFLVQAKKLEGKRIRKNQLYYNKGKQLQALIEYAKSINAFPAYILYASQIKKVNCRSHMRISTPEGVFFEPAENMKAAFDGNSPDRLKHKPISCFFACYHSRCYYSKDRNENNELNCDACNECEMRRVCEEDLDLCNRRCFKPFESFLNNFYNLSITPHCLDENILLFVLANSVMIANHNLAFKYTNLFLKKKIEKSRIKRIVVSDYLNRHNDSFVKSIMGEHFIVNHQQVLSLEEIKTVLYEESKKIAHIISNVGIFGSYARGKELNRFGDVQPPTADSDIDVAIMYTRNAFTNESHARDIISFVKAVISRTNKNVDFVDYAGSTANDIEFKNSIDKYMLWLY